MPTRIGIYDVYGTLGKGKFSKTRFAVERDTNLTFAIKIVNKEKVMEQNQMDRLKNEIAIMTVLKSAFCLSVREVFTSATKVYIVLDLMGGESLLLRLKKGGAMSENVARHYFQQLVCGVEYCHGVNVVIYDLRLDNILLDGDGGLKISDFSAAKMDLSCGADGQSSSTCLDSSEAETAKGFTHHLSPELLSGHCIDGRKADLWSMALILYSLVLGAEVLDRREASSTATLAAIAQLVASPMPDSFSNPLKSLLSSVLVYYPSDRLTLAEVRAHRWMQWGVQGAAVNPAKSPDRVATKARRKLAQTSTSRCLNVWDVPSMFLCNPLRMMGLCDENGGSPEQHFGGNSSDDDGDKSKEASFEDMNSSASASQNITSSSLSQSQERDFHDDALVESTVAKGGV